MDPLRGQLRELQAMAEEGLLDATELALLRSPAWDSAHGPSAGWGGGD